MARKIITNTCVLFFFIYFVSYVYAAVPERTVSETKSARRLHIPLLGIGPRCTGCPQHFCDDDPAVVLGYCCGCAKLFDSLAVKCGPQTLCPLNTYELCQQYEYMLHCCC